MKKFLAFFLIANLILIGCSSPSGPEKATQNFTENLAKGKVEKAKEYATEPTGKMLDMASAFGISPDIVNPDFEFNFVKDSIVDNEAWVTFIDEDGKEDELRLVKLDGKWLVNLNMKK